MSTSSCASFLKMVTRNLYETSSVVATLLHAFQTNNIPLAIQTSQELIQSEEQTLLFNALSLVWWLTDPSNPNERNQYDAFVKGDAKDMLMALCVDRPPTLPEATHRSSLPTPPKITAPSSAPTRWTNPPKGWTQAQACRLWSAVEYAINHQFHSHATYLVRPLLLENRLSVTTLLTALGIHKAITDALTITTYLPLAERILAHAFASICAKPSRLDNSQWERVWTKPSQSRCFSIPPEALATWRVQSTPQECLVGCPILVTSSAASNFWKTQVKKHSCQVKNNTLVFPSDELCESFYNNFPIDIPDEWSLAERAKSHGIPPIPNIPTTTNPWIISFLQLWA